MTIDNLQKYSQRTLTALSVIFLLMLGIYALVVISEKNTNQSTPNILKHTEEEEEENGPSALQQMRADVEQQAALEEEIQMYSRHTQDKATQRTPKIEKKIYLGGKDSS